MMYAPHRSWSTLVPVIRTVISGRSELVHSVKNYGNPTAQQHNQPWNIIYTAQQAQHCTNIKQLSFVTAGGLQQKIALACTKPLSVSITTTPVISTADYKHNENEHAHSVLRSLPEYTCSTIAQDEIENVLPPIDMTNSPPPLPGINWNAIQPHGIAGSFIALSRQCAIRPMNISSDEHKNICSALAQNISNLTNEQLRGVLAALTLWPQTDASNAPNFSELWHALDMECMKRVPLWDLQHSFLIADLWYSLKLSRVGCYTKVMLTSLAQQLNELKPHELVQFLFHINLIRSHPANVSFNILEKRIATVSSVLSLEELGVIAMGLFKTQAFIKTDVLIDAYFDRLLESDISGVSSIMLGSIFKVLRKSAQAKRVDKLYKLLEKTLPILPQLSLLAQLQVALLGNDTMVFHPQVINQIALNFAENASSLRLKDIERMSFVLLLYNFTPPARPDIYEVFSEELRKPERRPEINQYPKAFLSCVTYLASMGILPHDLISSALQPSFVKSLGKASNYEDIGREVMELDCILDLEDVRNYKGHRLDPALKDNLLQIYFDRSRLPRDATRAQLTHNETLTIDIEDKLAALLGGPDRVTTTFIFPHVSLPDIVFCTGASGEPVPLPHNFLSYAPRSTKVPLLEDPSTGEPLQWTAVVVGGRNSYIRGTNRVRGQVQMKTRHLQNLGYNVTIVPFKDYSKRNYRRKLGALNDILVSSGAITDLPNRVEDAYAYAKSDDGKLQEQLE
uniref:FAST kinase domain-containing protein 5 n=1 Tax=Hirondellea gigas TaxID=1518452 RepID=A0A2P2I2P3_9CRUS